jgi:uncharacterized protein (DUF779 family)
MGAVVATPAAEEAIMHLRVAHGAVAFRPPDGCRRCDSPSTVTEAELPAGINDLQLGEIGGVAFLIYADQYRVGVALTWLSTSPKGPTEGPHADGADGSCLTLRSSR